MAKRIAALAALVVLLGLAGCASEGSPEDASTERSTAANEASDELNTSADETPEPLSAETPVADSPEALFVIEARDRLAGLGAASTIPSATDEQLVVAGQEACAALSTGTAFNDVTVIEGEERVQGSYLDSAAIATAGVLFFCPELNGTLG